ncbi:hypothetical protein Angca_008096 [Angiostrongylus cantonensis]|nr:hypothetical protein Angca_008096 [Angiostrongylus cantonensis]
MSEPDSRLPTTGRIPSGTTSVGALPPLTLPPPRLDPLAGISSVHHSYASSLSSQVMSSPIPQSSPASTQSPLSQQMLSPQQKTQSVVLSSGHVPPQQQQPLQDIRRQSTGVLHSQEQIRGQFAHTVTTLPSNKRPNEMGRQIQSVPNSPASLAISTPPQSVQMRHSSLDAQPSPGSSSVGNPSPSYSNHSSPSVVQLHNGHGPPSSYVQSSTMPTHGGQSSARFPSLPTQEHMQHHIPISSLPSSSTKQVFQHDAQARSVGGQTIPPPVAPMSLQQRNLPVANQLPQSQATHHPSLLQQQLSVRPSRMSSQPSSSSVSQANVVIQQQPIPQSTVCQSQQNGQQCIKPRAIPNQEGLSRQLQSTSTSQQQHVVMGLLQGAQIQQQTDGSTGYGCVNVSNPHVRQILANRTSQVMSGPGPSASQQDSTQPQSPPPRMSPASQQQAVVPQGILPSQANLPLRSVLAAQQHLSQQPLLQQQRQSQQVHAHQAQVQQQLRLSGRMVGTASGALATLYDADKSTMTLTNKDAYRILKRRFKYLVYENECYQEELRNLQRKLLKLSRDKNFLLDRLGQFEKFSESSDEDSDASNKTCDDKPKPKKRIRPAQRKRAADECLEGSNVVKRSADESNVSTPSPSESPALDARSSVMSAPSAPYSLKQLLNPPTPSDESVAASGSVPSSASAHSVSHLGSSNIQTHHQQHLRTTLARVVPSNMLGQQQSHVFHQTQTFYSSSRAGLVDTRPIMAKVRVETTSPTAVAPCYASEPPNQQASLSKSFSKDSFGCQLPCTEFTQPSQDICSHPINGDNLASSAATLLPSSVSIGPPTSEPCPISSVSSMSCFPLLNGLLPEAHSIAATKEESSGTAASLPPPSSQYR